MNKDFHLYGTYMAALAAGYGKEDAAQIACAAQEVDDFDDNKTLYQCPTVTDILKSPISTFFSLYFTNKERQVFQISDIWMPFHFIPQNVYSTEQEKNLSKVLRCGYGTPMKRICEQLIPKSGRRESKISNARIGITMHVLGDSFAHKEYCGVMLYNPRIAEKLKVKYGSEQAGYLNDDGPGSHMPVWMSGVVSGIFYFGHGSSGHIPDLSWAVYCHEWKYDDRMTREFRNNTKIFLEAFHTMVEILKKVRGQMASEPAPLLKEEDVADFVEKKCAKIRRDRSNIIDRNRVIDDAVCIEKEILENGDDVDYEQNFDIRYISDEDVVLNKELKMRTLLAMSHRSLSLDTDSDTVFEECLDYLTNSEVVRGLNERYSRILNSENDQEFEEAAMAHKEAVYEAIGLDKQMLLELLKQEFRQAIMPAHIFSGEK